MIHVVALSGGKDSTAMALRLKELNPDVDYTYVLTPTGDEFPDMFAHWRKLSEMLGKPLTPITAHTSLNGLIKEQNALPNWRQRWCTRILKIEPYAAWLAQHTPCVSYVGLRADEENEREGGDYSAVPGVEMRFPMQEWGWGIQDVLNYLDGRGVKIPQRTDCRRCFFQTIAEWHDFYKRDPEGYAEAEQQEAEVGHTFRSPGRDTWPAGLAELRQQFDAGRRIPSAQLDLFGKLKCRVCRI